MVFESMKAKLSIIKWIRKVTLTILILLIVLSGVFIWWGSHPLEAMPEAIAAMESDQNIEVSSGDWIVFNPRKETHRLGIIIYPGGRIDPIAYAPLAKKFATGGDLVIIPKMPLNLAVFGIKIADEIINAYPEIQNWVIGGHSLGGAMAVEYVSANPSAVDGLFLWASYFAAKRNLQDHAKLECLTIYGTMDSDLEKIRASRKRLPSITMWHEIEGGNHAQFGWYGKQHGDGSAIITREVQQEQVFEQTSRFLNLVRSNSLD